MHSHCCDPTQLSSHARRRLAAALVSPSRAPGRQPLALTERGRPVDHPNDSAITVRMPRELYDALKVQADAEERSLGQLVRRAAREYIERHRERE